MHEKQITMKPFLFSPTGLAYNNFTLFIYLFVVFCCFFFFLLYFFWCIYRVFFMSICSLSTLLFQTYYHESISSTLHQGLEHRLETCPCNEHPFTPYFYIVKLGFTRIYIFLIFALKNILWVLVRTASARQPCNHNLCFKQKLEKYHIFSSENYHFYSRDILHILHGHVCVMLFLFIWMFQCRKHALRQKFHNNISTKICPGPSNYLHCNVTLKIWFSLTSLLLYRKMLSLLHIVFHSNMHYLHCNVTNSVNMIFAQLTFNCRKMLSFRQIISL